MSLPPDAECLFDLEDDADAQWFAWGVWDGAQGKRRTPPERDGDEPVAALFRRTHSYQSGLAAGSAFR